MALHPTKSAPCCFIRVWRNQTPGMLPLRMLKSSAPVSLLKQDSQFYLTKWQLFLLVVDLRDGMGSDIEIYILGVKHILCKYRLPPQKQKEENYQIGQRGSVLQNICYGGLFQGQCSFLSLHIQTPFTLQA